jgi:hypothetical protein
MVSQRSSTHCYWVRHLRISLKETDSKELVDSRASEVHRIICTDDKIKIYPEMFEEMIVFHESERRCALARKLSQTEEWCLQSIGH